MTQPVFQVSHVSKHFGSGTTQVVAVQDVSLSIMPGEVILIMGPSGSGKTTLLSMLGALLRPSAGVISLNGAVISEMKEDRLPAFRLRQFGFIFQDFNLLSALTVLANVAVVAQFAGLHQGEARRKGGQRLARLGLGARLPFLPEDLAGPEKPTGAVAPALINERAV